MKLMDLSKLFLLVTVGTLISCAGETLIEDRYSLDYLDAKTGKPLVYPAGLDVPDQSTEYDIPKKVATQKYDVNQIVKPPRIVPLPKEDEDEDKD
ncbi:MAG: outer membrane protein assembly factor BamC [Gammaproteobacteria bacterium]|nr:outer membrane protein assembly factor BamC [Gammaproteobacteria bacterium]